MSTITKDIDATELIGALSPDERKWLMQTHEDYVGYGCSMMIDRFKWSEAQAWAVCDHLDQMDKADAAFAAATEID